MSATRRRTVTGITTCRPGRRRCAPNTTARRETGRELAEAEERYIHFNGHHVQDPPAHGDYCVDSCPYDTPDQARERAERAAWAEAREAEYANAEAGQ